MHLQLSRPIVCQTIGDNLVSPFFVGILGVKVEETTEDKYFHVSSVIYLQYDCPVTSNKEQRSHTAPHSAAACL